MASLIERLIDVDAERAVVAHVLFIAPLNPSDALASLDADDFATPSLRLAWETAAEMWAEGIPPRAEAVHAHIVRAGRIAEMGAPHWHTDLATQAGGGAWQVWADVVARNADSRRLAMAAHGALEALQAPDRDTGAIAAELARRAQQTGSRVGEVPRELAYVDDVLDAPDDAPGGEWLIPGVVRRNWRVILTGAEGLGKMVLLRQLAWSASQGCFPFAQGQWMEPIRTLLVDMENPRDAIQETGRMIRTAVRAARASINADYDPQRQMIYEKPGGMEIRTRKDRVDLEAAIAAFGPDMVIMGPQYKMFRRGTHETDEQAAQATQQVLDDLRTRHKFALVLEAHSAKGSPGSTRSLEVSGSSAWMRWPEVGIGIRKVRTKAEEPETVKIERWRGDRVKSLWPEKLERDSVWPWVGVWGSGVWRRQVAANEEETF